MTDNFIGDVRKPIARSKGVVKKVARQRKMVIETRVCLLLLLRALGWRNAWRKAYDVILSSYLDT